MTRRRLFFCLCFALAACGPGFEVHSERSTIATFGRYGTYAWATPAVPARSTAESDASLLDWRIRNGIDGALGAKGYTRTEAAPSLFVDYAVVTRRTETDSFTGYFRYRSLGGNKEMGDAYVSGYDEGTLVVRLIDAQTRELAYRASASAVIEQRADRQKLAKAIDRMFANLPSASPTGGGR